jgi:hypothetical protein
MQMQKPRLLSICTAALALGICIGWLLHAQFVVLPTREALALGLREEMSRMEQHAIAAFKETNGPTSIAAQQRFIELVQHRDEKKWIDHKDAQRAIGMAKLRIAAEPSIAEDDVHTGRLLTRRR